MANIGQKSYLLVLAELRKAISEGNFDDFKILSDLIDSISNTENQVTLKDCYDTPDNPLRNTNLAILASQHNQAKILLYLFGGHSRILNNLSVAIKRTAILPNDEDETHHNAFYYAIRSGNIELLDTLINKWPDNYFAVHLEELDEIISIAYEELKLRNVSLSDKMEIFVENKLIDFRFFSNTSGKDPNCSVGVNNTRERIELLLQNINLLIADYSNTKIVDGQFIYVAKFIARNIHILKQKFKSSYDRLPWEEMEFCVIAFVSSYTKQQDINIFYRTTLKKDKILFHLGNFAKKLEDEKDIIAGMKIGKCAELPQLKREEVITKIISSYPAFEELYSDFQSIRDIHSMKKISAYVKLVSWADPTKSEGQVIITRVLQVMGEYLKNSLESPNLSNSISEILILFLPKKTRDIVVDLRNSQSYPASLLKENTNLNFLINVKNDSKIMGVVIADILYKIKIKTIGVLMKRIIKSKNAEEIKEIIELLRTVRLDEKMISGNFKIMEHQKLKQLVKNLSDIVTDKTTYEEEQFEYINDIMNRAEPGSKDIITDSILGFVPILNLSIGLTDSKSDLDIIGAIKFHANKTLYHITPILGPGSLTGIAELSNKILNNFKIRIKNEQVYEITRIICEIFCITEFETSDVTWFEELRETLNEIKYTPKKTFNVTEKETNNQLTLKLTDLKSILSKNSLSSPIIKSNLSLYKRNKNLQAAIEMLVLDIMSILSNSRHCLEDNILFLDGNFPSLTGKCLHDHLTHGTELLDILLPDPSIAVFLNARKLAEVKLVKNKKMIGKLVIDDSCKLRAKFDQGLVTTVNQEKMFVAAEEGNLENFKVLLKNGTDMNGKSFTSWTTLHFAAKGPNLEVVKFILDHNISVDVKDMDGQSPLHIAAASGREDIVEFLVEEAGFNVDDVNNRGKTPLHVAAQNGHKNCVEVLLKNNANFDIQDIAGHAALHCAIINNHFDVVKILLEKDENVDVNEAQGGITPLLAAVEFGHLEMVNFLLQSGADVFARTNKKWTSLHLAALNGHLEIVKTLIHKGSVVNSRVLNGCTPLHYAANNGNEEIADILLKYGADVNACEKIYRSTPLHYATKRGHEKIVTILLKNKASVNTVTVEGLTPLHIAMHTINFKIAGTLIEHGANVHAKDINYATPLHHAAESGDQKVVALLIQKGVEINAISNDNSNALHLAAQKGHKDVVDLLIKNNANVNAPDVRGVTPLHEAAMNGNIDIVDLLIKSEAKVDARANNGSTPLHIAVLFDNKAAADFLIKNEADINAKTTDGLTPLHLAAAEGYKDIINLLINNKAQLDVMNVANNTPVYTAVKAGHKEIVEILTANGADVNLDLLTSLASASICNHRDITEMLLLRGANFDAENSEAFFLAIVAGHIDIVEIFLKNVDCINIRNSERYTGLHLAAMKGNKEIVNALIRSGADINSLTVQNVTPICLAAIYGHEEIVKILIASGADVNYQSLDGFSPLHIAASRGLMNIAKILLDNKAQLNAANNNNSTPLNYAVRYGHLQLVKMFLLYQKIDLNAKGEFEFTLLHSASEGNNVEIVKHLVDEGCDMNAINTVGTKPIHIAAREGHKDIIEFFVNRGLSINERGTDNQTLLHYAIAKGQLEVVKYLIEQGADVNALDINGLTPMHFGAYCNYKDIIKVLFKSGAVYNSFDLLRRIPLELTQDEVIKNLLTLADKLFESVKQNNSSDLHDCIRDGAFINGKNSENVTVLHIAAWKGYKTIVNILLLNKANPNIVTNKGMTPLHYAAKFGHLEIVRTLLSKSAIYNALSDSGKTPSDLTQNKKIIRLFKLVDASFTNVKDDNSLFIAELNNTKDMLTIKAIMGAHNRESKTLIVAAMHSHFTQVKGLKEIAQGDVSVQIDAALQLLDQENYSEALSIFKGIYVSRRELLGPDSPGTLDIQNLIAKVACGNEDYEESLRLLLTIFQTRKEILGMDDRDTLSTRNNIALVLHRQGKNEDALKICQEVHKKQTELLGLDHSDTLDSRLYMALVLHMLGKYEKALHINREVLEKRKKVFGASHKIVILIQNNIATVLTSQGNYEEALKAYKEVFEKNMVLFGYHHIDTLRALHLIATVYYRQKKYREALETHQQVLNMQKSLLGPNHIETLNNKVDIANILFEQGKWINAFKVYVECFDQTEAIFEPNSFMALEISKRLKSIKEILELQDSTVWDVLQYLQTEFSTAASHGETQTIRRLLKDGLNANDRDIDGRTPLYFAVRNGQISVINILLQNEADVTQVTNKGNTALHAAASKGNNEIVKILLNHVSSEKLNDFINFKTTASGATSLHVAARSGNLDIAKSLLKKGAIYNIKDNNGKTPLDLSRDQDVSKLLQFVEGLFEDSRNGNVEIVNKVRAIKPDEILIAINCRNKQGKTLLQVATDSNHKIVTIKLLEVLKTVGTKSYGKRS